jgi:hypothetical protein
MKIFDWVKNFPVVWGRIHNTSFSSQLTYFLNKLEWYIRFGLSEMRWTYTLAYWANSKVKKKIYSCEYSPIIAKNFTTVIYSESVYHFLSLLT